MALMVLVAILALVAGCGAELPAADTQSGNSEGEVSAQANTETNAEADAKTTTVVTVFKTPTCGCCSAWVDYMRQAGFVVETQDLADLSAIKAEHGIAPQMQSCHTAIVDGYVIEGHVPASDVERLLSERPNVAGLAVPGMPMGSPGMEVPGRAADPFDVLAFTESGEVEVFTSHR